MRNIIWVISMLWALAPLLSTASLDGERPPGEMLRLMDLLRAWDLVEDLDVIKRMRTLDRPDHSPAGPGSPNDPRAKIEEPQK